MRRHGILQYRCHRRGRGRNDVRVHRRAIRAPRCADRPRRASRRKNSHLGRRALQLHQPQCAAGQLSVGESAFLPLGARALYAARFSRAAQDLPREVVREAQGPAFLRRLQRVDHRRAKERVRCGPRVVAAARERRGDPSRRRALCARHERGRNRRGGARHRDRRPVDSKDRRDGFRLSRREAVRLQADRYAPGARAADLHVGRLGAVRRAVGAVAAGAHRDGQGQDRAANSTKTCC